MPRFYLQSLGQILVVACAAGINSQAVPYFQDLGMDSAGAAALYSGALGTLMFGKFILGFISDKITIRRAALFAPVMFMCTFLALYFMGSEKDLTVVSQVFIWTYMIGGSISTIIPPLLTAKNYGDKDFGGIMGVITMEGNIGQILGPLLASLIFDTTGSYQTAWFVYAALTLAVGLSFYLSTRISRKQALALGHE
jgi:OFA family oxalate/formate antiporter-like MFS transporter